MTFTGWEYSTNNGGNIITAPLYHKVTSGNPDETGLGVVCQNHVSGDKCSEHEINSDPSQAIDINISSLLLAPGFSNLSIEVSSVDSNGGVIPGTTTSVNEEALLWGLSNVESTSNTTPASATRLDHYLYSSGKPKHHTFNFTKSELQNYSALELTTGGGAFSRDTTDAGGLKGNVLLSSVSAAVPEPGALGILGAGLLFIAFLARGLGRRSSRI